MTATLKSRKSYSLERYTVPLKSGENIKEATLSLQVVSDVYLDQV